ncbi:MAG: hypothetical protein ACJ746_15900 [Bryobacteraceae bacterium]
MEGTDSRQDLLRARALTRLLSDHLQSRLKDHLATLTPVFRARNVLGDYVQGTRDGLKAPERALKELQEIYRAAATAKPFYLTEDLRAPIDGLSSALALSPCEYVHQVTAQGRTKAVTVTTPCRWVLTYAGYEPAQFRQLLANRERKSTDVHQFVLHYCVMQLVLLRQPGIARLFEAMRFPVSAGKIAEFGEVPVIFVSSAVSTELPPDDIVVESTEISGQNVFEEVVDVEALKGMEDPVRRRLMEVAGALGVGAAGTAAREGSAY